MQPRQSLDDRETRIDVAGIISEHPRSSHTRYKGRPKKNDQEEFCMILPFFFFFLQKIGVCILHESKETQISKEKTYTSRLAARDRSELRDSSMFLEKAGGA